MTERRNWILLFVLTLVFSASVSFAQPLKTKAQPTHPVIERHKQYKTPIYIKDQWNKVATKRNQSQQLWIYLNQKKAEFKIKDARLHFAVKKTSTDRLKQTHYRVQQIYNGVKVYGAEQTFHFKPSGELTYLGLFIPPDQLKSVNTKPKLTKLLATEVLKNDLKLSKLVELPKVDMVLYPDKKDYRLAYFAKITIHHNQPAYWYYFIDAHTGKILAKYNALQHVTGHGKGVLGDDKNFDVRCETSGSPCYLDDVNRKIQTYDAEKQDQNLPGKLIKSSSTTFNEPAGVDAHTYAEKTFDFYKKKFGRNSFDDKGGKLISSVHVGDKWNNAAWDGKQMLYGDGDGKVFTMLSGSLDVVAHELTHAVTENTANLQYWGESGALNESISDIMGATIDSKNWLLGEDIYTPDKSGDALRSLADPPKYKQPDHYKDRYIGFQDNGGVHTNSGINNKAAYLIAAGGTHHQVKVQGIGRDKMSAIYYRALTLYLTPNADFAEMRKAAIESATDLYGANSAEVTAVKKAYDSIGVN
ncbi:thermolysin/neutral peptidase B [Seinonella peptonophila]|uniref:Neutral metalloproteinase n=1 Tax=Seinonella peptonophila TaxID=112248 RepID=A0A1M4W5F7_9BACL|nr:M4 family metallopeptidase [Seinonella peptonophila]SHE76501.1 thermolysin/neutral peptidase B [Seinonella peptonophila]